MVLVFNETPENMRPAGMTFAAANPSGAAGSEVRLQQLI